MDGHHSMPCLIWYIENHSIALARQVIQFPLTLKEIQVK